MDNPLLFREGGYFKIMKRIISSLLAGVLVLGSVFFAGEANAQTVADLQAQIQQLQALIAQVQALQAQLQRLGGTSVPSVAPPTPSASCVTVSADLSRNSRGNSVTALQQALR